MPKLKEKDTTHLFFYDPCIDCPIMFKCDFDNVFSGTRDCLELMKEEIRKLTKMVLKIK